MSKIYDYIIFNFYTLLNYIYYNLYKTDHRSHDNSATSRKKLIILNIFSLLWGKYFKNINEMLILRR